MVYLGGDFTWVSPYTGGGVPIDSSSGSPVHGFPRINGVVNSVITDGSGGWYAGGKFTKVGNVIRNNIVHIKSDNEVDQNWDPGVSDVVNVLVRNGSFIYVGGDFATIGGQTRNSIACVDAATGTVTSWKPDDSRNTTRTVIYAIGISGSKIM